MNTLFDIDALTVEPIKAKGLNRLQQAQLKDILKVQTLKINQAPKGQKKPAEETPLFAPTTQTAIG